jgi:hypothetical protein
LEIWGLQISPKRELFLKTIDSIGGRPETFWNKLEETDRNAEMVISSIYQRVMSTYKDSDCSTEKQMQEERERDPFEAEVFNHENGFEL